MNMYLTVMLSVARLIIVKISGVLYSHRQIERKRFVNSMMRQNNLYFYKVIRYVRVCEQEEPIIFYVGCGTRLHNICSIDGKQHVKSSS